MFDALMKGVVRLLQINIRITEICQMDNELTKTSDVQYTNNLEWRTKGKSIIHRRYNHFE